MPPHPAWRSIAVDDTSLATFAALYGDPETAEVQDDDDDRPTHMKSRHSKGESKLKVREVDNNGRPVYTADDDARASWATGTNSRPGHTFIGYHLILAVACKAATGTSRPDQVDFGDPVPEVVLGANLVPGGSHRGESLVPVLVEIKAVWPSVDEVLVDPGYSLLKPERFFHPVRRLGYDITSTGRETTT